MKEFAQFNNYPHQQIAVPDGGFTASFQTSEGKRLTVSFVPYKDGGPAQCVDVQYHDSGTTVQNGRRDCPTMHAIGFTPGHTVFDTRSLKSPTTLLTVLIGDRDYAKT